jgi:hypothetical protein
MKKRGPKRQHTVPRSYLSAWTDPACPADQTPYVWVFPKEGGGGKKKAPENIFHEIDFYTRTSSTGERDLSLEEDLGWLENAFIGVRRHVLEREADIGVEDRAVLLSFLGAMHARTPRMRDHHGKVWGGMKAMGDDLMAKLNSLPEEERRRAAIGLSYLTNDPSSAISWEEVTELAAAPMQTLLMPIAGTEAIAYANMEMVILTCDCDPGFITSDCPAVWFDPEAYKRPPLFRSPGLGHASIEVTMPISPSQMLVVSHHDFGQSYLKVVPEVVHMLNQRTRTASQKAFVTNSDFTLPAWF